MLKTVNFRNVEWFAQERRPDLVQMLTETLAARPNIEQTWFEIDGQGCEVNHRHVADGSVFLHFTTFVEGGRRATYPRLALQLRF